MSVGATLAAARRRAGLSVSELSSKTRVTEAIIRGIERENYAECGGHVRARGHIRDIAEAVGADPRPLIQEFDATWAGQQQQLPAAGIFRAATAPRQRARRGRHWAASLLGLVILGLICFVGLRLIRSGHQAGGSDRAAGAGPVHHRRGTAQRQPAVSHVTAKPARPPPVSQVLTPISALAFGPAGPGRGDDPQQAGLAIHGSPANAWHTAWYTTPRFGNLQPGTGLLLDLGRAVTVTSARLKLSDVPGTDFQLRAGGAPALADLRPVAGASNVGGLVRLRVSKPARARYLLIWFTRLPPDPAGTFQVSLYSVRLRGRP